MNTIGDCFIHGKVITVTDNKLPSRARLSLPSVLSLKRVKDDGGDDGEWQSIQSRVLIELQWWQI